MRKFEWLKVVEDLEESNEAAKAHAFLCYIAQQKINNNNNNMIHYSAKTIICLTVLVIASYAWSQDMIVTTDSKKIDAKILEVSKSEIKYKASDYLDGPTFVIGVEDIVSIIYANGNVVLYNHPNSDASSINDAPYDSEDEKREKATALVGLFGNNQTNGEQSSTLNEAQIGYGSAGYNSCSLSGRSIKTLPKPSTNFNQEGKVVVEIVVNAAGNVVSAHCTNGTTVTDQRTIQVALDAARKAKFSKSTNRAQVGTITYTFKFN